jgi:hypothetical protein
MLQVPDESLDVLAKGYTSHLPQPAPTRYACIGGRAR